MSRTPTQIQVALADQAVYVKIAGRANFSISVPFRTLVSELRQKGHDRFVIDLQDCLIMDSTFLGVLAWIGRGLSEASQGAPAQMELLNVSPKVKDLIENLGIDPLFKFVCCGQNPVAGYSEVESSGPAPSQEEVSRTCLEAHQVLMEVNPDNVAKFKDVAKFLEEDLRKMQKGG